MKKGFVSKTLLDGGFLYVTESKISNGYNLCNLYDANKKYIDMVDYEIWKELKGVVKCIETLKSKQYTAYWYVIRKEIKNEM